MRWRLFVSALSSVVLLAASAPGSFAQAGPDIFVTPIPNVPFSGVIDVERSVVQQDGSVANFKTIRNIGRDDQGRIHNESRALVPVSDTQTPQLVSVRLYDPLTRVSTVLNPQERTFRTNVVNRPPATAPPALLQASPAGNSLPQNQFTREEDLGTHEMEGVPAHGVRESQMIPAEVSGTGKEIVVIDEYWYSDDLHINLMIKHSDPRTGGVSLRVIQVKQGEPDRDLFEVPEGYTLAEAKQQASQ